VTLHRRGGERGMRASADLYRLAGKRCRWRDRRRRVAAVCERHLPSVLSRSVVRKM